MNDPQFKKSKKQIQRNFIESLKDIGAGSSNSLVKDVIRPQEVFNQILGVKSKKFTGEINPGESIEMNEVITGKQAEKEKLHKQLALEKQLREEEAILVERKSNELKIQLHTLTEEVIKLTQNTKVLSQEIQIAAMQAPVEPGVYHIIFFEKLIEYVITFRKNIEDAANWLHATNNRAQKKNYWSRYKKSGSKFLLSADHYLTRSQG